MLPDPAGLIERGAIYPCPLDHTIPVIEVAPAELAGTPLEGRLNAQNLAFSIWGGDDAAVIVVNKMIREQAWFTESHMTAILTHELGHIIAQTDDESEAEEWAIKKCIEIKDFKARDLLLERGVMQNAEDSDTIEEQGG